MIIYGHYRKRRFRNGLCLCILLPYIYHNLGQNWCCVFKKVQFRSTSLRIAVSDVSQGHSWFYAFKMVQYNADAYNNNSKRCNIASRTLLRIKETPDLHLTYSKNGGNLGLALKMKNTACISILLTKHVKYTFLYSFKFVLYSSVTFKAN